MRKSLTVRWMALVMVSLLGVSGFVAPAPADLIEDVPKNFTLETPHMWARLPQSPAWKKLGIVLGAERRLDKLKSGTVAKGEGGQVHLAITDLPEGRTIEDMAVDDSVRGFLLKRFGEEPETWPEIQEDRAADPDTGLEYVILKVDAEAPNLKARTSPVRAVMLLAVAKKKLFQLRMYAWHTEYDEEGLKGDLDVIEMSFAVLDPTDDKEKEGERPPDADPEGGEEEVEDKGDTDEEREFANKLVGWRVVKPVGIRSKEWDKEKQPDIVAWFEESTRIGSYQVILFVMRRGRQRDGVALPDQQLKGWGLDKWWPEFDKSHPDGPVRIYKFPKRGKKFLVLPDPETEKMLFKIPKLRPKKPKKIDGSTMIKKWKNAEKMKGVKLGDEKCIEAYRGVLGGSRQLTGREIVMHYVWGTPRLTCMLIVSFSRDAQKKWGEEVQKLLDSIEMTGRP